MTITTRRGLSRIGATCLGACSVLTLHAALAAEPTVHKGEDGRLYTDQSPFQDAGKIAKELVAKLDSPEPVEVILYLRSEPVADQVAAIKSRYRKQLDNLRDRLREIQYRYRPDRAMDEDEERQYAQSLAERMTASDRQQMLGLQKEQDQVLSRMRREIGAAWRQASSKQQSRVSEIVAGYGGEVRTRVALGNIMGITVQGTALRQIAEDEAVLQVTADAEPTYELNISVPSASYGTWWGSGFDGGAYDVGVVDTGVQENHPAFTGINFVSAPGAVVSNSSTGDHGTHVAGIVASGNATYRGGAYGLDAVIWANSGAQSTTMSNMDWMASSAAQGPEVVNHSLGYGTADDVDYSASDAFYDAYVSNYHIMVSKSAGNNGWDNSDPSITHPAPAYNLMAVANMDDQDTVGRSDDVRRSSSSVGPTLNGRRKPDITAPGTDIMSTNRDWSTEADFIEKSGTSMAAPHVAAAVVVMEDGGNHEPMAQKAVLINTADAWDSNNTSSSADDQQVFGSHWDKSYGWGYLDMWESHFNRSDYFVDSVVPRNDNATPDDYHLYKGRMYTNEKSTLVWERRADFAGTDSSPSGSAYGLSDLNIRLYDEDDGSLDDYDFDGDDNVHQVAAEETIDAVVKVYSWSTGFSGVSSEQYAVATEESFERADPPSFGRTYSAPTWVRGSQSFNVTVTMNNNGEVAAHDNTLTLGGIAGVTGTGSKTLPSIAAGGSESAVYNLQTSAKPTGNYWLWLNLDSDSYAETYNYNTSFGVYLRVDATLPVASCTSPLFSLGSNVAVSWTAADAHSGIGRTYLYAKTPGSASFVYTGQSAVGTNGSFSYALGGNGSYEFATRSVDAAGNWEPTPTAADCRTNKLSIVIPTRVQAAP